MAKRKGQVVAATLVTPDTLLNFPIVDTNDIGGGRHIYDSIAKRNAIPPLHRKAGMIVYVGGTIKTDYILKPGFPMSGNTSDNNWEEYKPGVDPNTLTEHQKLEDIQYRNPVDGCSTLVQKLQLLQDDIDRRLIEHQRVENIAWQNPSNNTPSYPTLKQYLEWLENKTSEAAQPQYIDTPISWLNKPSSTGYYCNLTHKTDLSEELIQIYTNLNNPTVTKVYDKRTNSGEWTDLQTCLDRINSWVPTVEEINRGSDGTPLTTLLTVYENPSNIIWSPGLDLRTKIQQITQGLDDVSVETIKWDSAPSTPTGIDTNGANTSLSENLINIFTKLTDMNKEDKIIVTDTGTPKTLYQRLLELQSAVTTAATPQNVEDIDWKTQQGSESIHLSDNLIDIWTTLTKMNDPDYIDIPPSATGHVSKDTLTNIIAELYGKFDTIHVRDITWDTVPSTPTGIADNLGDDLVYIYTQLGNLANQITNHQQFIEDTVYNPGTGGGTPGKPTDTYPLAGITLTRKDNLRDELNQLYTYLNKAEQISVPKDSTSGTTTDLKTYIENLNTQLSNLASTSTQVVTNTANIKKIVNGEYPYATPQYLLFSINEFEGNDYPFETQEYLTAWKARIAEITAYVNADANIQGNIKTQLEISSTGSGYDAKDATYTEITSSVKINTITIDPSAGTSYSASLASLAPIPANSRIRVRIKTSDPNNTLSVYSLRVKLICEP